MTRSTIPTRLHDVDPGFNLATAAAFWSCLAVSAALFAGVVLAPRMRTCFALEREYADRERGLVASERQVERLQNVVDALKNDPHFAAELARVDFDASRPGDERIPVSPELSLGGAPDEAVAPPAARAHWFPDPLLDRLADDPLLRRIMLGTSAFLVVLAFTFLCDSHTVPWNGVEPGWGARCRMWLSNRYSTGVNRSQARASGVVSRVARKDFSP